MSSEVDLCNLALSHLGEDAEIIAIDPPDGSILAAQCGRFYPMARDTLLEMHPWSFATVRASLALTVAAAPSEWAYAYALPALCIKPNAIYLPTAIEDGRGEDYLIESDPDGNGVVYTNAEDAVIRYTRLIEDTTKFTPGFGMALSRLLASYLAGPIIKGSTGIQVSQAQMKWFTIELGMARTADANRGQRSQYNTRISDVQRSRGGGARDAYTRYPDGYFG